jgi:hypothetical protein
MLNSSSRDMEVHKMEVLNMVRLPLSLNMAPTELLLKVAVAVLLQPTVPLLPTRMVLLLLRDRMEHLLPTPMELLHLLLVVVVAMVTQIFSQTTLMVAVPPLLL